MQLAGCGWAWARQLLWLVPLSPLATLALIAPAVHHFLIIATSSSTCSPQCTTAPSPSLTRRHRDVSDIYHVHDVSEIYIHIPIYINSHVHDVRLVKRATIMMTGSRGALRSQWWGSSASGTLAAVACACSRWLSGACARSG